jgi:hypothetical protein
MSAGNASTPGAKAAGEVGLETLVAGKDGDFAVVKNLHVVIKNGRPVWFFKLTPKPVSAPLGAIRISRPTERPKERPIK